MDSEQLNGIIARILEGSHTERDMAVLSQLFKDVNSEVKVQLAKYNINIADGKDIHIGDRTSHKSVVQKGLENVQVGGNLTVHINQFHNVDKISTKFGTEDSSNMNDDISQKGDNNSPNFFAYDNIWAGREQLISELSTKLRGQCRILLILGITGIGKTALAEKMAVELQDWFSDDWKNKLLRANFDYDDKSTDFVSVANRWFEEWGQRLSSEERKPEALLHRLVKYLRDTKVLVLIDSVEKLLTGNQEDGWGDFSDKWWEKFFLNLLSAESCESRLIITSQDLPVKFRETRYQPFCHREILDGLTESEQIALFKMTGLDVSEDSLDRSILLRIGKAYKGHPLVLRVIIGEILSKPFNGDVQAYWNDERENTGKKIEEVEKALIEAEQGKTLGEKDEFELHKLTREVRNQVNKERLQISFRRLAKDVKDAYILICAASVYRAPEKEEYWLKHLVHWLKRLEKKESSKERQTRAVEELDNRFLVETKTNQNGKRVLGQHNLIRSVAIEHRNQLLQSLNRGE